MAHRHVARYQALENFYLAGPRRISSAERDVGLWWRERLGDPPHRAAWVADTGELYLVRLGSASTGGGLVEVLAVTASFDELERHLGDWRERCGQSQSLSWLRAQTARLTQAVARNADYGPDPELIARAIARRGAVLEVRDLRACSTDCCSPSVSARIVVRVREDCHAVRRDIERTLARQFGIDHATLQVDHQDELADRTFEARRATPNG